MGISRANAVPVTFPSGQVSTTISINITDDRLVEGSEQFSVHLVSGGGIADLVIFSLIAEVNIADNDGKCTSTALYCICMHAV